MKLEGKAIVLTGAASGIGQALLHELAALAVKLVAVDLDETRLTEALRREANRPAELIPYMCDVGSPATLDALFAFAAERMGHIDLFIANAGFAYYERIEQPDWERLERLFQVNVFSPIYSAEKMRWLNPDRPYRVVITASAMALLSIPGYSLYGATKAALDRFAEGYRFELPDRRMLTLVYPIATRTRFFERAADDAPVAFPSQPPEAVARAIMRGIMADRPTIHTSRLFQLLLLVERIFPPLRWIVQAKENRQYRRWQARRAARTDPSGAAKRKEAG